MSLPRYPKYKDSGVEWLGEVPEHWDVVRLRQLGPLLKGSGASKEDVVDEGVPCVRYGDLYTTHSFFIRAARTCVTEERSADYTPIQQGDVLFAASGEKMAEIGKSAVNLMPTTAYCGGDIILLRPTDVGELDVPFLGYACDCHASSVQKASMGRGTTIKHIYPDELKRLVLTIPPRAEQTGIAAFLDSETSKIDALVTEQERLIELLKEKRQAVISHAVTKGLNPNAPMKESGIEWLGRVPEHWPIQRVKHVIQSIEQGWSPQCESYPVESEVEWGVLKVGCVNGGVFSADENKALPAELDPVPELGIRDGDLLVSRANTRELVGSAAVPDQNFPRLMLCDKLYRLRVRAEVCDSRFISRYLGAAAARSQLELSATGASASMVNIGQTAVMDLLIALPPLAEQRAIVRLSEEVSGRLGGLIAEALNAIDLLQERRTALISAAVTGQIDVRSAAARRSA